MANVLKHKKTSGIADGGDAAKVRPTDWNAEHAFAGGSNGNLLRRNTGETDGVSWTDIPIVQALQFLLSAPASPQSGYAWLEFSGTSPARDLLLKVQDGATLRTVVLATF